MTDNQSLLAFCQTTALSIPLQTIVLKYCLPMLPTVTVQAAGSGAIIARAVSRADMEEQLKKQDLFLDGWPSCVLFADVALQQSVSPEEVWASPETFPQLYGGINIPPFTGNFLKAVMPYPNYQVTSWHPDDPNMYIITNRGTNRVFQTVPLAIQSPSRQLQKTNWILTKNEHVHPEYGTFHRNIVSTYNIYSPNGRYSLMSSLGLVYDFRLQQRTAAIGLRTASGGSYFWIRNTFVGQVRGMDDNGKIDRGVFLFVWTVQGKLVQTIALGDEYREIYLNCDHTKFAFKDRIYY